VSGASEGREVVSIVTVVMNRLAHLLITAPHISRWVGHDEHLILDWSSDPPIQRETLPVDARIRLLRVEGEKGWCLTRAYNFAIRMARGTIILKLDADCWITQEGVSPVLGLEAGTYQRSARGGGLNGILLIRRLDFLTSGGFHEGLQGYGHDDKDLFSRLDRTLLCRFLPPAGLHTLEHGDGDRVASQKGLKGLGTSPSSDSRQRFRRSRLAALEAIARMEESKARNRWLAERWPWSADQPRSRYAAIGADRWRAEPASLPSGDPAIVTEAMVLGNRVYLSLLLGLPERFLDQHIATADLERVRSWESFLRLQAWLRLVVLMPLLRLGLRLQSLQGRIRGLPGLR